MENPQTNNSIPVDLFNPLRIRELDLESFFLSPMSMYSGKDGEVQQFHNDHYLSFRNSALGGIIIEATAVAPEGRCTRGCLGLWNNRQQNRLAQLVEEIKKESNAIVGIQLHYAGTRGSVHMNYHGRPNKVLESHAWSVFGFTPFEGRPPTVPSEADERRIRLEFGDSARLAEQAGFDLIEIHMAHGYLLHDYLSNQQVCTNIREFPVDVFSAVREAAPSTVVGVRLSHGYARANDTETNVALASKITGRGCDFTTLSDAGLEKTSEKWSVTTAETNAIRADHGIPVMLVGGFDRLDNIARAQNEIGPDFYAIGRGLLRNPMLIHELRKEAGLPYTGPEQYTRAFTHT